MQRLTGIMLIMAVGSAALAGCALRDPRDDYAYRGNSEGLWNTSFEIIDWNFPTSVNQGPIERPERLRLDRTAIGVTWATRNPIPLNDQSPAQDAPPSASTDDGTQQAEPASGSVRAAGVARERSGTR